MGSLVSVRLANYVVCAVRLLLLLLLLLIIVSDNATTAATYVCCCSSPVPDIISASCCYCAAAVIAPCGPFPFKSAVAVVRLLQACSSKHCLC